MAESSSSNKRKSEGVGEAGDGTNADTTAGVSASANASAFRQAEKRYKEYAQKKTDFADVVDVWAFVAGRPFCLCKKRSARTQLEFHTTEQSAFPLDEKMPWAADWSRHLTGVSAVKFTQHPGLYMIPNALNDQLKRFLVKRSLLDYPTGNPSNIGIIPPQPPGGIPSKLRWITLGYHYDWTLRIYPPQKEHTYPEDLAIICSSLARFVGLKFVPQATIVNYYPKGSTLGGHLDDSEFDFQFPIVSISLGNTGVFLFGGETKDVEPIPLYVRDGDVIIMSGPSRLCYHGVPRIMTDSCPSHYDEDDGLDHWGSCLSYIKQNRININARQVLAEGASWPENPKPPAPTSGYKAA